MREKTVKDRLLDLLFPPRCPLCERVLAGGAMICPDCERQLPFIRGPVCFSCGVPVEDERQEYCRVCAGQRRWFDEGRSLFYYEKAMRESVIRMKFHNRRAYIPFYARAMAVWAGPFLERTAPDVLVPVPMHPRKERERGFDQCALLCAALGEETGIPYARDMLVRTRYTAAQKGLDAGGRRRNVQGAFAAGRQSAEGLSVMLIDDIYTTGSTMDAAARCLKEAGARSVFFTALCTERIC